MQTRRASWRLAMFLAVSTIAAACGSDVIATPDAPESSQSQPAISPSLGDTDAVSVPTTAPQSTSSTTTAEPASSTEPPLLESVQISAPPAGAAANGQDPMAIIVEQALTQLAPGGSIEFQPGVYPPLTLTGLEASPNAPVRFVGGPGVEFRGESYDEDAGILIQDSSHIEISGMSVSGSLWGIYIQNSSGVSIVNNDVSDVGQEAIRVKDGSSNIIIDGNRVADTGRRTENGIPNGEGIYIGTGTPGGVDHVSNVVISNNIIERTADEAIDIKRPSSNITIVDNTISDVVTNTSGAIVIHLNNEDSTDPNISIERNVIHDVTRSSEFRDGNCIVVQATVRIVNNVLHNCQHRGIYVRGVNGVATILHNTFLNTGSVGVIVDEGLGMEMMSENNLGVAGTDNALANEAMFRNPDQGDYRLSPDAVETLDSARSLGVREDLLGSARSLTDVTYGAVEAG